MNTFEVGDVVTPKSEYGNRHGTLLVTGEHNTVIEIIDNLFLIVDNSPTHARTSGRGGDLSIHMRAGKTKLDWRNGYWSVREYMMELVSKGLSGVCRECMNGCGENGKEFCEFKETVK